MDVLASVNSFYTPQRSSAYDSSAFHQKLAGQVARTAVESSGAVSRIAEGSSRRGSSSSFRLLDICCGTGLVANQVAEALEGKTQVDIVGLDASSSMLDVARSKTSSSDRIRFAEGDASKPRTVLGAAEPPFDCISCCSSIVFLSPTSSLRAWSQLLVPSSSSKIVFDVPTPESSIRNVLLSRIASTFDLVPNFNRRWVESQGAVKTVVASTGTLEVQGVRSTGILSTKSVATSREAAEQVWEDTLKITNMNPFPEALARGTITMEQLASARESFVAQWIALGDGAGSEVQETMENWIFVCGLVDFV